MKKLCSMVLVLTLVGLAPSCSRTPPSTSQPEQDGASADKAERDGEERPPVDTGPSWPDGAGYGTAPQKRPASPHSVEPGSSEVTIADVDANGAMLMKGRLEIRESRQLVVHPGCTITYLCKSPETHEMPDYNGDTCTLIYGLTVKVDEYGQFVPVQYDPDAEPAESPE